MTVAGSQEPDSGDWAKLPRSNFVARNIRGDGKSSNVPSTSNVEE
jgi:hypothetical protein